MLSSHARLEAFVIKTKLNSKGSYLSIGQACKAQIHLLAIRETTEEPALVFIGQRHLGMCVI